MWSQCGDVTGRLACRLALVLLPARGGLLLGVLGAEAGPGDLDEVRTVSQPVERRRGEEWLAEELGPLRAVPVAGERDGPLFVSLVDHVVQVLGPRGAKRLEPEVIEDQEIGPRVPREPLLVRAVGAAAREVREHLGGVDEEDFVPAAARLVGEGLRQVALADARRAVDEDALVTLDEGTRGEIEDLRLVELRIEAEVEALERLGGVEGGAAQAQPQVLLRAALDLIVQEHGEELDEGRLLLDGLAVAQLQCVEDAGQPQGAQHRGELVHQFHEADLLSSAPGSGKKVVQGRAWRGAMAGAAAAGTSSGSAS